MDPQESAEEFHTHTPNYAGWASFEARVRGRRFARVVEIARTAIDQGRVDEATAALEEARSLVPEAPEIVELEQRLAAPQPVWNGELMLRSDAPEVELESDPGWLRLIAGMAVVALLLFFVGFGLVQVMHTSTARELLTATSTATTDVMQLDTPRATTESKPASEPTRDPTSAIEKIEKPFAATPEVKSEPEPVVQPRQTAAPPPRENTPATEAKQPESRRPATSTPAPTSTMGSMAMRLRMPSPDATPAAVPPPVAPAVAAPERAVTDTPPASATPSTQPPVVDTLARVESAASPSPMPVLDVPVRASHETGGGSGGVDAREQDSAHIRALLSRYETAYNRLDAKAASAVWPGVNQAALGRAFDGLLSQRVSLGLCDITVIGDIAGASCAGKARWEPKVGGGLQTADRYWKFNLRKTDDGWKIQEILVR